MTTYQLYDAIEKEYPCDKKHYNFTMEILDILLNTKNLCSFRYTKAINSQYTVYETIAKIKCYLSIHGNQCSVFIHAIFYIMGLVKSSIVFRGKFLDKQLNPIPYDDSPTFNDLFTGGKLSKQPRKGTIITEDAFNIPKTDINSMSIHYENLCKNYIFTYLDSLFGPLPDIQFLKIKQTSESMTLAYRMLYTKLLAPQSCCIKKIDVFLIRHNYISILASYMYYNYLPVYIVDGENPLMILNLFTRITSHLTENYKGASDKLDELYRNTLANF